MNADEEKSTRGCELIATLTRVCQMNAQKHKTRCAYVCAGNAEHTASICCTNDSASICAVVRDTAALATAAAVAVVSCADDATGEESDACSVDTAATEAPLLCSKARASDSRSGGSKSNGVHRSNSAPSDGR